MTDPTREAFAVDEDTINLALDAWFDGDCSRPHYDEHIDQMRAAASVIVAALSARAQGEAWPSGVLNRETTLHVLTEHNACRRGAMTLQTDPVLLGKALDAVVAAMHSGAITTPTPPAGEWFTMDSCPIDTEVVLWIDETEEMSFGHKPADAPSEDAVVIGMTACWADAWRPKFGPPKSETHDPHGPTLKLVAPSSEGAG